MELTSSGTSGSGVSHSAAIDLYSSSDRKRQREQFWLERESQMRTWHETKSASEIGQILGLSKTAVRDGIMFLGLPSKGYGVRGRRNGRYRFCQKGKNNFNYKHGRYVVSDKPAALPKREGPF